jgi:hypothetical protein
VLGGYRLFGAFVGLFRFVGRRWCVGRFVLDFRLRVVLGTEKSAEWHAGKIGETVNRWNGYSGRRRVRCRKFTTSIAIARMSESSRALGAARNVSDLNVRMMCSGYRVLKN